VVKKNDGGDDVWSFSLFHIFGFLSNLTFDVKPFMTAFGRRPSVFRSPKIKGQKPMSKILFCLTNRNIPLSGIMHTPHITGKGASTDGFYGYFGATIALILR